MHVLDKDLSYEEVAIIFVRVNSLGMKLRGSDLALALITSRWRDSLKLFEKFQEECEEKWFSVDLGLIVRALVVFATNQSRFKTVGTTPLDRLTSAWDKAKDGLRFAVNFLRANAGVEDESLLSSPLFLIALAYYADRHDYRVTPDEENVLRRWLYIGIARGHYSRGSSESVLDADLRVIQSGAGPQGLLELLAQQFGRLDFEPSELAGRGERSGLFPVAYLALKAKGAKDWRTRLGLSLSHQGRTHTVEYHHIFPKALLKKFDYDKSEVNEIANMAFVSGGTNRKLGTTPAEKYLSGVLEDQGREALDQHCIPLDPELWKGDRFRDFLEYRRRALTEAINEFILDSHRERGTVIDIRRLIAAGESEQLEFKTSARWDHREGKPNKSLEDVVVKAIGGFLNGKGGTLLIGINDDGAIIGLDADYGTLGRHPNRDGYQQFLVNLISASMGKDIATQVRIEFHAIEGDDVCSVRVPAALQPVFVIGGQGQRFFVRVGNTTQEFSIKDAMNYIRARWKA